MDRNENGYPTPIVGGEEKGQMNSDRSGCGGDNSCLDQMTLAYVYAPNQQFRMLYSANEALRRGTLFEELYKPMEVYGNE